MKKLINNELDFTLNNNETVKLTLNFELLLKVKKKHPEEYDKFNKVVLYGTQKSTDIFEMLSVIYVAYLCANLDNKEKYTSEEFNLLVPFSISLITKTENRLLGINQKN